MKSASQSIQFKGESMEDIHSRFLRLCTVQSRTHRKLSAVSKAKLQALANSIYPRSGSAAYVCSKVYAGGSEGVVFKYASRGKRSFALKLTVKPVRNVKATQQSKHVVRCTAMHGGLIQLMPTAFVDGFDLHGRFLWQRTQPGGPKHVCSWIEHIANFLLTACDDFIRLGMLYLDIKPENILLMEKAPGKRRHSGNMNPEDYDLCFGDVDSIILSRRRPRMATSTYCISTPVLFDGEFDTTSMVFSLCCTMFEFINDVCTKKSHLVEIHDWSNVGGGKALFDLSHPLFSQLNTLDPSSKASRLRAPFATILFKLAHDNDTYRRDRCAVQRLLRECKTFVQQHFAWM